MVAYSSLLAIDALNPGAMFFAALGLFGIALGIYRIKVKRAMKRRHVFLIFYRWEPVRGQEAVSEGYSNVLGGITMLVAAGVFAIALTKTPGELQQDRDAQNAAPKSPLIPGPAEPVDAVPAEAIAATRPVVDSPFPPVPNAVVPPKAVPKAEVTVNSIREKRDEVNEELRKQAQVKAARELERKGPEPSDPAYLDKLADRMSSDNSLYRSEAIDALLQADPEKASTETTEKIARAFRILAEKERSVDRKQVIEGLVKWGGNSSVPALLKMLKKDYTPDEEAVIKALADLNDVRAPALAARLGDYRFGKLAFDGLAQIGDGAEDALMEVAPSGNPEICIAAITLLGDVGTQKCLVLLNQAEGSRNRLVRSTAMAAVAKINRRRFNTKSKSGND